MRRRTVGGKSKYWLAISQIALQQDTFHLSTSPRHETSCSTVPQCSSFPLGSHEPAQPRAKEKWELCLANTLMRVSHGRAGNRQILNDSYTESKRLVFIPNCYFNIALYSFFSSFNTRDNSKELISLGLFRRKTVLRLCKEILKHDHHMLSWVCSWAQHGYTIQMYSRMNTPYKCTAGWMAGQDSSGGQGHALQWQWGLSSLSFWFQSWACIEEIQTQWSGSQNQSLNVIYSWWWSFLVCTILVQKNSTQL